MELFTLLGALIDRDKWLAVIEWNGDSIELTVGADTDDIRELAESLLNV